MPRAETHLLYGVTGTYKTTNAGFFARYIWHKYHKPVRLVSADPGGWRPLQPLVDVGIVIPYTLAPLGLVSDGGVSAPDPLVVVRKISRGMWVEEIGDGKASLKPTNWKNTLIGGYIVESLNSIGDLEMESISRHTKAQGAGGEDITVDITIEGERFAGNNRSHFGFVQKEMANFVRAMGVLPVPHVLFTAIEAQGEEEDTREAIRGPAIVGKKATAKAPTWVGDCIHMESFPELVEIPVPDDRGFKSKQLRSTVRAYFVRHPDPRIPNVSYPAKPRVPSELAPKLQQRWPGGYFMSRPDGGLDEFLEYEDQLEAEATEAARKLVA